MNSNTVKKWLSFGLAISLLTGNTTVLQAEEEPVETEDLYEVTEDTESEAAVVETAAEENEIDPEAENQEVPEGSLKDASGMYEDVNDFETRALGSDGVQYDGVSYLSVGAVSRLPEETQDLYLSMADDLSEKVKNGETVGNAVFAVNQSGEIAFACEVSGKEFASRSRFGKVIYEEEEAADEAALPEETETAVEEPDETLPEETVTIAEETENAVSEEQIEQAEEEPSLEEVAPETTEETIPEETVPEEIASEETEASDSSETTEEKAEESEALEIVTENEYLFEEMKDEQISEECDEESIPFTVLENQNFFYNQLTKGEKSMFKKGKTSFVSKGGTSMSFNTSYWNLDYALDDAYSAIDALMITYPNKFEWFSRGEGSMYYLSGTYSSVHVNIKPTKSQYYSTTLYNTAKQKVDSLVEQAYTYANNSYPSNRTYGMVRFFDEWLCANNYYNNTGTRREYAGTQVYYYCHTAFGTLLNGYGVCESYALAMNWLLDTAGIRNMYCVGDVTGGGHAWNYVQMPDGKWYLVDSTWDDSKSTGLTDRSFFLVGKTKMAESGRTASGTTFRNNYLNFDSANWATSDYSASAIDYYFNQIKLNKTSVLLTPKKTFTLKAEIPQDVSGVGSYYSKWPVTWTSSNPNVAKVSSSGKVTAVALGKSDITMRIGGKRFISTVYVYNFKNVLFNENSKTKLTKAYAKSGTVYDGVISANFTSSDTATIALTANQSTYTTTTVQDLVNAGLAAPKATSNKKSVAEVQNVSVSGNTIYVQVKANAIGTAKITVKFAGKKAVLTFTPKYQLNSSWFDSQSVVTSNTAGLTYAFKAYKPKVAKTYAAPSNLKFKTTYTNNKNAGTATITITGTGNYTGTVTRTFNIAKADFTNAKITSVSSLKYTGTAKQPKMTVKIGKKTLNPKTDYIVYYSSYEYGSYSTTIPTAPGTYFVKVQGTGNFKSGVWSVNVKPFTIK